MKKIKIQNLKIPQKVIELFDKEDLVAFATSDEDGNPNVVPIFWKKIINGERILLLDNFMRTTKQNLQKNNKVCISFWNSQTEEAYKIKGIATYHTNGPIFEEGVRFIQSKNPGRIPRGVVDIKVIEIFSISPGADAGIKII
jgi:predicted pyridoxine 5'-phosphate oxidase superfamily flavin-nucleotide-binding protein